MTAEAELLPASMADLAEVIGLPAVLKLMDAFGGTEFWVPQRMPHHHPLVDAVGAEAAQTLSEYMAGERLKVPRGKHLKTEIRNRAIRRERNGGAKLSELALKYELTDRQVMKILNANPEDDNQGDLFE